VMDVMEKAWRQIDYIRTVLGFYPHRHQQ